MARPRTAALLTVADVFDVIADRLEAELPIVSEDIAVDLSVSRRSLCRVVERDTGLGWEAFISPVLRTQRVDDGDDSDMKRITVALPDETFTALRRAALADLRDPRLQARRILEDALVIAEGRPTGGVSAAPGSSGLSHPDAEPREAA